MRLREIDVFRGIAIVGMVFFTMIFRLSRSLPDFLIHNVRYSLHIGDFVLPMFLFASGMSIVFFAQKRKKEKPGIFLMDVAGRFGKLAMIALFLSPFSAGEALGMDEVMLSALLFVPSVFLARYDAKIIAAVAAGVIIAYFSLAGVDALPDFTLHYLGGYQAAVFYLPVMLCGLIAGKTLERTKELMIGFLAVAVALMFIVPACKLCLTPSFMMLSAALSMMVFEASKRIRSEKLEFLGRNPIRYWVLMFLLMVIPLSIYEAWAGTRIPLGLGAPEALIITIILLPAIYMVSRAIDVFYKHFPPNRFFGVKK
jgi:predicted acyltransferase